jgi:hypothetical protein
LCFRWAWTPLRSPPRSGAVQETTTRQRLRISMVFVIFEGGMPLIGLGLGSALVLLGGYLIAEQIAMG